MKIKPWIFGILLICAIIVYLIIFFGIAFLAIEFLKPSCAFLVAYIFGMLTSGAIVCLIEEKKDNKKEEEK